MPIKFCPVAKPGLITGLNTAPFSATGLLYWAVKGMVTMIAFWFVAGPSMAIAERLGG